MEQERIGLIRQAHRWMLQQQKRVNNMRPISIQEVLIVKTQGKGVMITQRYCNHAEY